MNVSPVIHHHITIKNQISSTVDDEQFRDRDGAKTYRMCELGAVVSNRDEELNE